MGFCLPLVASKKWFKRQIPVSKLFLPAYLTFDKETGGENGLASILRYVKTEKESPKRKAVA